MSLPVDNNQLNEIKQINRNVNSMITYKTDGENHPELVIPEQWDVLTESGFGDCDDYAASKRHQLREMFPDNHKNFRLATCWDETDAYHAVLLVETEGGVYVLDNRHADVVKFNRIPYRWHQVEDVTSSTGWSLINF